MIILRIIDRARNWYSERVTDPETGKVIHETEEAAIKTSGSRLSA